MPIPEMPINTFLFLIMALVLSFTLTIICNFHLVMTQDDCWSSPGLVVLAAGRYWCMMTVWPYWTWDFPLHHYPWNFEYIRQQRVNFCGFLQRLFRSFQKLFKDSPLWPFKSKCYLRLFCSVIRLKCQLEAESPLAPIGLAAAKKKKRNVEFLKSIFHWLCEYKGFSLLSFSFALSGGLHEFHAHFYVFLSLYFTLFSLLLKDFFNRHIKIFFFCNCI